MAMFNFAQKLTDITTKEYNVLGISKTDPKYLTIHFTEDGHLITHGVDFTPTFKGGIRGLVPTSHNNVREFLRGNSTWATITTADLPMSTKAVGELGVGETDKLLTTKQLVDYVKLQFSANDAMRYKGSLSYSDGKYTVNGSQVGWPNVCEVGDTYRITGPGTYGGHKCNTGDMLICIKDNSLSGTDTNNSTYWSAIEANINGHITHHINGVARTVYSNDATTFNIYAPKTAGNANSVLIGCATSPVGVESAPTWKPFTDLIVGEANKVTGSLQVSGSGLTIRSTHSEPKSYYNGSILTNISLNAATKTTLGGVIVDKDSTGTITLNSGNIYLSKQNIINALGYTPGNVVSMVTVSAVLAETASATVAKVSSNPYFNIIQTQNSKSTVVGSLRLVGSEGLGIAGSGTTATFTLGTASADNKGAIKVYAVNQTIASASTSIANTSRNYGVMLNTDGKAFVNVPWSTHSIVTDTADGIVPKMGTGAAGTINSQANHWVLTRTANNKLSWNKLPTTAFSDTWRTIKINGTSIDTSEGKQSTLNFQPSNGLYLVTDTTADGTYNLSFDISWWNVNENKYEMI